jgi:hypothetical protein
LESKEVADATEQWLDGTAQELVAVNVNDREVIVTVEGAGELRPLKELADSLATTLERPLVVKLRTIPTQREISSGN